jgi:UDP-glucose 4-epimerase
VVAIFAGGLLEGHDVTINGSGEQTRDYVFVDDVVKANMAASRDGIDGRFNVGTGVETSVVELYRLLLEIIGGDADAAHAAAKKGEQMRSVLDGSRLRELAGLPAPIALRDGLRQTVAWLRARTAQQR